MDVKQAGLVSGIAILIIVAIAVSNSTADAAIGTEIKISDSVHATSPAVYGNWTVWVDAGGVHGDFGNILLRNISSGELRLLAAANRSLFTTHTSPAIYEDKVIWVEETVNSSVIHLYDISTNETSALVETAVSPNPAIYEDLIVWQDDSKGSWDIYMYNISTEEERQLTMDNTSDQINPAIYEDRIVWQDDRNYEGSRSHENVEYIAEFFRMLQNSPSSEMWDIYMYNVSTGEEKQITTHVSNQINPAIYDDILVWQDYRNWNWDIYTYDLSSEEMKQITTNESVQWEPAIYKDKIAWVDNNRTETYLYREIYMYNISTEEILQITDWTTPGYPESETSWRGQPSIYENKIVWSDERGGMENPQIFMFSLGEQRPPEWQEPVDEEPTNDVPAEEDVNEPSEQLKKLQDDISNLDGVDTGTKSSLSANLNNAITMADKGDKEKSIDRLEKLIESIEKQHLPKEKLSPEQAEYIIGELERIIELINNSGVVTPPSDTPKMAEGTEMQVTTDEFNQIAPSIYGDKIVWRDGRHVPFSNDHSYEIYSYDLVTGEESRVTEDYTFVLDHLSIYDNIIVWLDHRHYSTGSHFDDVYMLDLTTGQEQRITTSGSAWYPVISGKWIAYKDGTYLGDTYVYAYNVDSGKIVNTTETAGTNMFSVYDERLIWPCEDDFCFYDLSTSTKDVYANATPDRRLFANKPGYSIVPEWGGYVSIYENTVVWVDYRDSNWDIYMYNLSSSEETQLTINVSSQILPEIYGDKVVWQDDRNGNWDIFMYDLTLKEEFQITEHAANQTQPAIYENKIVWQDDRNGNYDSDIYMFTLTEQGYSVNQENVDKSAAGETKKTSAESRISSKTAETNVNTTAGVPISNSSAEHTEEPTGSTVENTTVEAAVKAGEDDNTSAIKDAENKADEEKVNATDESSQEAASDQVVGNASDEPEEESPWQVVENTTGEESTEGINVTYIDESPEEKMLDSA
ncbi:MAG: hypothetical protein PWP14_2094 [Methanolobus sp.]|nr:hypothetical protein [Methanolobus sp.]